MSASVDILIVGAGPVGLMCAHLARQCGLTTVIVDKSEGPLRVGRADALNARSLQLLELAGLFEEIYPQGKPCNTSSVYANGRIVSRQSRWWDELSGCLHKHFLMLGQSHIERALDHRLNQQNAAVWRSTSVDDIVVQSDGCLTTLSSGKRVKSKYVVGADGSRSFVREKFRIPFEILRPQMVWAVIDGVIETDFPKSPEIVVFQAETSDVAWIPREGALDRFYIRMDKKDFSFDEAVAKINQAMRPHALTFKEVVWFSQFSVKESVAEKFSIHDRVFLAGDACHIHSVNGGQGLNTGLGDAFNLIWKLNRVLRHGADPSLLRTYEAERRPVAQSVIASSGELVRATKFSANGTHAEDYVKIVEKRAGNITGMGIRYGEEGPVGTRLYDFQIERGETKIRLYSVLNYAKWTLLIFGEAPVPDVPDDVDVIRIHARQSGEGYWMENPPYVGMVLVRPDSYIAAQGGKEEIEKGVRFEKTDHHC